jgi:hypothetical protein
VIAEPQSTSSDDARRHFFKLSLELREKIYDYVAYDQTSVELYVDLGTVSEPEISAYDENRALSRTCSQLRLEYMTRLRQRIKRLDVDHKVPVGKRWVMPPELLIAERKVSKNVWVQDVVALRWIIPFEGMFEDEEQRITLTFTVASDAMTAFNQRIRLPTMREDRAPKRDLVSTMTCLQRLKDVVGSDARKNWWMSWWNDCQVRELYYPDVNHCLWGMCYWIPGEYRVA